MFPTEKDKQHATGSHTSVSGGPKDIGLLGLWLYKIRRPWTESGGFDKNWPRGLCYNPCLRQKPLELASVSGCLSRKGETVASPGQDKPARQEPLLEDQATCSPPSRPFHISSTGPSRTLFSQLINVLPASLTS